MRPRWVLLIALLSLTIAPGAAAAADPPVLGPADGVQATRTGEEAVELRFTGASTAAVAGREVTVECAAHPAPGALLFVADADDQTSSGSGTVGADGVLAVKLTRSGRLDACDVEQFTGDGSPRTLARASLDDIGTVWVDEAARAHALRDLLAGARSATSYRFPGALPGGALLPLADPAGVAPAGQLGYWDNGAGRAVATTTSLAGRRLLIEDLGDGALRTNVLNQGDVLSSAFDAALSQGTTGTGTAKEPDADAHGRPYRGAAVDSGDGVRARFAGRRLTVRFTGRSAVAARKLAGRRVSVTCVVRPRRGLFGGAVPKLVAHSAVARMPRHGRTLTATLPGAGDVCAVVDDGVTAAHATATDAGRRWWADVAAVDLLDRLPDSLAAPGDQAYRSPVAIVAAHKGLVAMAGPGVRPARGQVGVWTDGAGRAAVAVVSASGRRLYMADEGDGILSTNVFGELAGLLLFEPEASG